MKRSGVHGIPLDARGIPLEEPPRKWLQRWFGVDKPKIRMESYLNWLRTEVSILTLRPRL
jgi:hypothetical protein